MFDTTAQPSKTGPVKQHGHFHTIFLYIQDVFFYTVQIFYKKVNTQ